MIWDLLVIYHFLLIYHNELRGFGILRIEVATRDATIMAANPTTTVSPIRKHQTDLEQKMKRNANE